MQKKYKTKVSRLIMEYIELNHDVCFCAADVDFFIKEKGETANLATIYRNLEKLTNEQVVSKFKTDHSSSFYFRYIEKERACKEHLHMQCKICGKLYHLEGSFMEKIARYLDEEYDFLLECEHSSISGICKKCKGKMEGIGHEEV